MLVQIVISEDKEKVCGEQGLVAYVSILSDTKLAACKLVINGYINNLETLRGYLLYLEASRVVFHGKTAEISTSD